MNAVLIFLILCLVIATAAAVTMTVLYIRERSAYKSMYDLVREIDPLTKKDVVDAIWFNGFIPVEHEDCVEIRIDEAAYYIRTNKLPYLSIESVRYYDGTRVDADLLHRAADHITHEMDLVKLSVFPTEDKLWIRIESYEPSGNGFRNSMKNYVSLITVAYERWADYYEDLHKNKDLTDYFLHRDNGNGKARKFLS